MGAFGIKFFGFWGFLRVLKEFLGCVGAFLNPPQSLLFFPGAKFSIIVK